MIDKNILSWDNIMDMNPFYRVGAYLYLLSQTVYTKFLVLYARAKRLH